MKNVMIKIAMMALTTGALAACAGHEVKPVANDKTPKNEAAIEQAKTDPTLLREAPQVMWRGLDTKSHDVITMLGASCRGKSTAIVIVDEKTRLGFSTRAVECANGKFQVKIHVPQAVYAQAHVHFNYL